MYFFFIFLFYNGSCYASNTHGEIPKPTVVVEETNSGIPLSRVVGNISYLEINVLFFILFFILFIRIILNVKNRKEDIVDRKIEENKIKYKRLENIIIIVGLVICFIDNYVLGKIDKNFLNIGENLVFNIWICGNLISILFLFIIFIMYFILSTEIKFSKNVDNEFEIMVKKQQIIRCAIFICILLYIFVLTLCKILL